MRLRTTRAFSLALLIAAGSAAAVSAAEVEKIGVPPPPVDDRVDPGQVPPPHEPAPPPEKKACISDHSGFRTVGKVKGFVLELHNGCEQTFRCELRAYIVTEYGPTKAHTTLTLGPASKAASARKSHIVNIRSTGGEAHHSRKCREI